MSKGRKGKQKLTVCMSQSDTASNVLIRNKRRYDVLCCIRNL